MASKASSAIVVPKRAATVVLTAPVTDSITSAFKVLLLKRTSRASFMPNLFVFPGGACDPSDASPAWHEPPLALPRLSVPLLDDHVQAECLADRVCALRETFEETGILLSGASSSRAHESVPFASASSLMLPSAVSLDALPADARARVEVVIAASVAKRAAAAAASSGAAPPAAPADEPASLHARAQRCVHADSASFAPICAAAGLTPPADAVLPFARWVTPHGEAKRFDTYFYVAPLRDSVAALTAAAPGASQTAAGASTPAQTLSLALSEVTRSLWATPAEALALARTGELSFAPPTVYALTQLAASQSLGALARRLGAKHERAAAATAHPGAVVGAPRPFYPYLAHHVLLAEPEPEPATAAAAAATAAAPAPAEAAAGAAAHAAGGRGGAMSPLWSPRAAGASGPARRYVVLPGDHEHPDSPPAVQAAAQPIGATGAQAPETLPFLRLARGSVQVAGSATDGTAGAVPAAAAGGALHRVVPSPSGRGWDIVVSDRGAIHDEAVL